MRTAPSLPYSGITLILDEPSRFDLEFGRLCSGPAGEWLNTQVLPFPLDSCDLRTCDCTDSLLPDTKGIILCGPTAAKKYGANIDPPGYLHPVLGKPAIPVFFPQDCCDYKNMRKIPLEKTDGAVSDRETKEKSPTDRENYRFWTKWHIQKFIKSLNGERLAPSNSPMVPIFYPNIDEVISLLNHTKDSTIYLDIETSRLHRTLSCIGFSTASSFPKVYVVPVYLYNGQLAYTKFYEFYRALSLALARNQVVIHNAMFDLTVLCGFFHMCYPASIYDTMVAHHRCFLEAEKSLAHAISAWTWEANHKDCNTEVFSHEDEKQLWLYNAKDVYTLKLIKDSQMEYALTVPGTLDSIAQANASILPLLDTSLHGLGLNILKLSNVSTTLEKHKALFAKIATILVGAPFNPGSSKQCSDYFHRKLNYDVIEKSANTGAASLGSKQLYQLQLKYPNPLIPVIIKYRIAAKDASMLETELFTL